MSIPLNPRLTAREIEACLGALQPNALLVLQDDDSAARQIADCKGIKFIEIARSKIERSLEFTVVEEQSGKAAILDEPDEPDSDAPAFILQSSGTTSEPKLIPFSHRNMLAAAARHKAWYDLTPQDRCLSLSPVFYSHGIKVTVLTPLLTGGAVAFPTDVSKCDYTEWFGNLKPTWYSAGPTLHRLIFDRTKSRTDAKSPHSLRFITGGGAPLPRDVLDGLQNALGVPVLEHYGSSEAALIASTNHDLVALS